LPIAGSHGEDAPRAAAAEDEAFMVDRLIQIENTDKIAPHQLSQFVQPESHAMPSAPDQSELVILTLAPEAAAIIKIGGVATNDGFEAPENVDHNDGKVAHAEILRLEDIAAVVQSTTEAEQLPKHHAVHSGKALADLLAPSEKAAAAAAASTQPTVFSEHKAVPENAAAAAVWSKADIEHRPMTYIEYAKIRTAGLPDEKAIAAVRSTAETELQPPSTT
jgi:hypothetical protein